MQQNKLHKTAAIYFSAGIGDALLLTPLIKQLKADGFIVTGIFTSKFHVHELYDIFDLVDEKILILSKPKLVWFITRYSFRKFDFSFVNYFAAAKRYLVAAAKTSREVRTNRDVAFVYEKPANIRYSKPAENMHDAEQNLKLWKEDAFVKENDFILPFKTIDISHFSLPSNYIVLQPGAGNNVTPYKIWPAEKWQQLLSLIKSSFPGLGIVLLGDKNELSIGSKLENKNIINLTGKTSLAEVIAIIAGSKALVGTDSGLMHLAVALNKPTFTIWGASNEQLYSYRAFNSEKHLATVNKEAGCRPCSSWHSANNSRFSDPAGCSDFICLTGISAQTVFKELSVFLSRYAQ